MPSYRERLDALLNQGNPPQETQSSLPEGVLPPEIDAIINASPSTSPEPTGMTVRGLRVNIPQSKNAMTADLMNSYAKEKLKANVAADKAQEMERAKQSANIPSAIRSLKVHLDQFQREFPSGNNSQAIQTAIGASKNILGKNFGIGISPGQRAVLKTLPLATIGLVRVSGALGRVSNQELDAAGQALNQAQLTDEERILTARNLAEQYLARIEPKELQKAIKDNPDLGDILNTFGVRGSVGVGQQAPQGGRLMVDAKGRKAYVFPDGRVQPTQ